ncbi:MAG: RHS repeat-associated core domain-containing protein, partial [Actinomycetota bacterium]|nr:RHS repeat-associated core domain-containing protein [Actinomycetota bacterium]
STDEGAPATDAASTRTEYNAEGQETSSLAPGATTAATETTYNDEGQEVLAEEPDGSETEYDYDATGEMESESEPTDAGTATTTYQHDLDARTTQSAAPDNAVTTYTYDLLGRQTSAGVGSQNRSTTVYNSLGWVLSETDFDGIVKTKTYDACGRVVSDSIGGLVTTQTYDTAGRLLTKSNPDGSSVAYTYDVFGRLVSERQVATDGTNAKQETTAYDSAGRLSQTYDSFTGTTRTYTYDADGKSHLTETRPSKDTTVTANVDSLGVLDSQSVRVASATVDRSLVATDVAGRVTQSRSNSFGAGYVTAYDEPGRIAAEGSAAGSSIAGLNPAGAGGVTYTYDPETGKKSSEHFGFTYQSRTETDTYTYSKTGRLVNANVAGVTTSYVYDPGTGRLTSYTRGNEPAVTFHYSTVGRLTAAGATVVTHDSLGRRTAQGPSCSPSARTYTWTGERLQRFTDSQAGVVATYVYDANGQRIKSVVTQGGVTTTTTYVYDGLTLRSLAASATNGTSYSIDYAYDETGDVFAGLYRAGTSAPVRFQIVTTDRGDVRELLDANGAAFAFYSYDAYGNPVSTLCSVGTGSAIPAATATAISHQPLRYASYAFDEHSALYYLSQRYLDPATMQFISKDPARADGEESAYQYCAGEPVGKIDPSGEYAEAGGGGGLARSRILMVPTVGQVNRYLCWAASIKCVYEYVFKKKIALSKVASKGGGERSGANLEQMRTILGKLGIHADSQSSRASHFNMKLQVSTGHPIIALGSDVWPLSRHAVVIYGYEGRNVWVMDPGERDFKGHKVSRRWTNKWWHKHLGISKWWHQTLYNIRKA